MHVTLTITKSDSMNVYEKDYPLAVDEAEARSMMYRDHIRMVMWALEKGESITFDIAPIA